MFELVYGSDVSMLHPSAMILSTKYIIIRRKYREYKLQLSQNIPRTIREGLN